MRKRLFFGAPSSSCVAVTAKTWRLVMMSVGLAVYFAWWLAVAAPHFPAVLGAGSLFGDGISRSEAFSLVSHGFQVVLLVFMVSTDQRLLRFYSSRITLVATAALASMGTLFAGLFTATDSSVTGGLLFYAVVGVASAFLLMFWGVAYSRQNFRIILVCSLASVSLAFVLLVGLYAMPSAAQTVALSVMPLLDLPFLYGCTPVSYVVRRSLPLFNPLPVNTLLFFLRLSVPSVFLGMATSIFLRAALFQFSSVYAVADLVFASVLSGLCIFAGALIALLALSNLFWDQFVRVAVIGAMACALLLLPLGLASSWLLVPAVLGCVLLVVVAWVFCGYVAQNFRISPILIFGIVHCGVGVGMMLHAVLADYAHLWGVVRVEGLPIELVNALACLVLVETLLPRPCDIKRAVAVRRAPDCEPVSFLAERGAGVGGESGAYAEEVGAAEAPFPKPKRDDVAPRCDSVVLHAEWDDCEAKEDAGASEDRNCEEAVGEKDVELADARSAGRFQRKCEAIANEFMLSGRETEVLFLLAKGYPTSRITEELFISKNTAKTHIAHIYGKLRIHSRQELQKIIDSLNDSKTD